jgi:hypothetical protein
MPIRTYRTSTTHIGIDLRQAPPQKTGCPVITDGSQVENNGT